MRIALIAASAALLAACTGNQGLANFTKHLNERQCWTKGSATGSAGLTGTQIGGHVEWECGNGTIGTTATGAAPTQP